MRLTTRTNLALRTLMFCAVNKDRLVRKQDAASAVNASENHLAQVINKLAQEGFITTLRGRHGGFHLARKASSISVGAVFRTFESELPFIECFSDHNTCPLKAHCIMRPHLARAVEAFYSALDDLYLSDLVSCNSGLDALLSMDGPRLPAKCSADTKEAGFLARPMPELVTG
jgi:Rrf2 family transcriptional regulator, nitric oxide-sensitive transcriptional repressor